MGGKRMPEGVATGRLGYPCPAGRLFDGLLDDRFMQMMLGGLETETF